MAENQLLQGEHIVMSSTDNSLCLTNFRVKYEAASVAVKYYQSIPLRKIAWCSVSTRHIPALLFLAAIALIGAAVAPNDQGRTIAGIAAVVLVVAYLLSRRGQIEIKSDAGAGIAVPTKSMKHDEVRKFAEAVAATIASMG